MGTAVFGLLLSRYMPAKVSVILPGMLWDGVHALVQRAKSGEREAVDALYRLTLPYLCRLAQKLMGPGWPDKSVSDLIQQSWLRPGKGFRAFRGQTTMRTRVRSFAPGSHGR